MPKKAIDSRITSLIRNGVSLHQRSFIVLVGDRGRDQVVNLHWILSQTRVSTRPSVLWCYKKELGFTSNRKKREKKINRDIKRGARDLNEENPFEIFVSVTNIRYTYYRETDKILGQTFGMCVLQDFEALTPNLLARTIETVEGGGLVCILLRTMSSLKQLYSLHMDVHSRYRTGAHQDVVARFNERFLLSLKGCSTCLVLDDELNVLPISGARNIQSVKSVDDSRQTSALQRKEKIDQIKEAKSSNHVLTSLVELARTADQAEALIQFVESTQEKMLKNTVSLTAARGRGKSACLGLAIAGAVASKYSNIFITSPSPENLKTLFEFVLKGFDALGYEEHLDYDIMQSTNPDFNKAIVRLNIFKTHRQTIQYIQPHDSHVLGQAELVVIDEAAAIPLPTVRKLIGNYLVFMASTINGYEGTGRSLSLKLLQQLRDQSRGFLGKKTTTELNDSIAVDRNGAFTKASHLGGRALREVTLTEPIRYATADPVEKWLNDLLCLDTNRSTTRTANQGCPHPSECNLFLVNRDTLFSYHPVSEMFLQKMMSLYVASHYKNSPNDLQLMSDAPAHQLYVLLPPIQPGASKVPEPLVVLQVALEGQISKESVAIGLSRGNRVSGDLIPWLVAQQFQDDNFGELSGARVVRIATNPEYMNMGYGSRSLEQLTSFFQGKVANLDEAAGTNNETGEMLIDDTAGDATLQTEELTLKDPSRMPPLLSKLSECRPGKLDYLGVSFGSTPQLLKFWKRSGYTPVYIRQTPNELTGEHTTVMLRTLAESSDPWLPEYALDFRRRFLSLLSYQFKEFPAISSLSILEAVSFDKSLSSSFTFGSLAIDDLKRFSPFDMKRLDSYGKGLIDHHAILDMVPEIAYLYFMGNILNGSDLTGVQSAILLAIGLQRKTLEDCENELNLPSMQILAMFAKVMKKVSSYLSKIETAHEEVQQPSKLSNGPSIQSPAANSQWKPKIEPNLATLNDELEESSREVHQAMRQKQQEMIKSLDLTK